MPGVAAAPRAFFADRIDAGVRLGDALAMRIEGPGIVLGMPRGGIPVALQVARALRWPLDVILARKVGVPGLEEVAFTAVAEGLRGTVDDPVDAYLGMSRPLRRRLIQRERAELERRVALYRGARQAPLPDVAGQTVVIVDDGLASGTTMRAAIRTLRRRRPRHIVAAVPVANGDAVESLRREVDDFVALHTPSPFGMVSDWYESFDEVPDVDALRALRRNPPSTPEPQVTRRSERGMTVALPNGSTLEADYGVPCCDPPRGLVMLVHGGGSSRKSYRNRFLAGGLRENGWATLRLDLLTPDEQSAELEDGHHRFDIDMISGRLQHVLDWATEMALPGIDRVVLFGASTGAAASVRVAATVPDRVAAVISRGGRVDLAPAHLSAMSAPLLLIVGARDESTLRANREVFRGIRSRADLRLVMGAGHTFEEPGAIGRVERIARRWLDREFPIRRRHISPFGLDVSTIFSAARAS